jgi:Helix-hairpin-helix motif
LSRRLLAWAAVVLLADGLLLSALASRVPIPLRHAARPQSPPPPAPAHSTPLEADRLASIALEYSRKRGGPPLEIRLLPQFRIRLRVNQSSAAALATIPGFSSRTAAALVAYRNRHGAFRIRAELLDVPGIGWATYLKLLGFVTLDRVLALDIDEPGP